MYTYVFFLIASLASSILYYYFANDRINLFDAESKTDNEMFLNILMYFSIALNFFLGGVMFFYAFSSKRIFSISEPVIYKKASHSNSSLVLTVSLYVTSLILLLTVYGDGFLFRHSYIPEEQANAAGAILLSIIVFVVVLMLGRLYERNKNASTAMFLVLIMMNITTGSRRIFIYMMLYLFSILPSLKRSLYTNLFILFYLLFSVVMLLYVIQLRHLSDHGLIPYLAFFWEGVVNSVGQLYFITYYLLVYGFFAASLTVQSGVVSWGSTLVALNPLPGGLAGWHDLADTMRINKFSPFTLYGEVFSMGIVFTAAFFFMLGIVFLGMEKFIRKLYFIYNKKYFSFFIFLFLLLFVMYSYEYNFRSGMRLLYYSVLMIFLYKVLRGLRKYLPSK